MKICVPSSPILPSTIVGLLIGLIIQQQQQLADGSPIINGQLLEAPWQVPFRHSVSFLRDPMPWEDGYFDPAYHVWPKSRQQMGDKQSVKLTSDESVEGVSKQKGGS